MITMDKKYQTRDGLPVRLLSTERELGPDTLPFTVVGYVKQSESECICSWTAEGAYLAGRGEHYRDLVEVKPTFRLKGVLFVRRNRYGSLTTHFYQDNKVEDTRKNYKRWGYTWKEIPFEKEIEEP